MADILNADVVAINGLPYHINGWVQTQSIVPFAGKVVTGDFTRDNDPIASAHIISDQTGGLGIHKRMGQQHDSRYYYSTCDTSRPGQLIKRPKAFITTFSAALPADDVGAGKFWRALATAKLGTSMYVSAHNLVDAGNVFRYNDGAGSWSSVQASASTGGALIQASLRGVDYLVLAFGTGGYARSIDGTAWTVVAADATHPAASSLCFHDDKVWVLDTSQQLWWTIDLISWTKEVIPGTIVAAPLPVPPSSVTKLLVFWDRSGEPRLTCVTLQGVYQWDDYAHRWVNVNFNFPFYQQSWAFSCVHNSDLHVPLNTDLLQFSGQGVRNIGLGMDQGLPDYPAALNLRGVIRGVTDAFNWLAAWTDVDPNTGFGAFPGVYLWNGSSWRLVWIAPSAPTAVTLNLSHVNFNSADSHPRLWIFYQRDGYFIDMPAGVYNPSNVTTWHFDAGTDTHVTYWFDGDLAEQDKLGLAIKFRAEGIAGGSVKVYYAASASDNEVTRDDDLSWTLLKHAEANGYYTCQLPDSSNVGRVFRSMRWKVELLPNTSDSTSPILRFLHLKYVKTPIKLYSYSFAVDCTESDFGYTPEQLIANLEAANESMNLLTLQFSKAGQELGSLDTKNVLITHFGGLASAGDGRMGTYQIGCVET